MHYNKGQTPSLNVIAETVVTKEKQITGLLTEFSHKDKGLPSKLLKILIIPLLLLVIDCSLNDEQIK